MSRYIDRVVVVVVVVVVGGGGGGGGGLGDHQTPIQL